MGETNPLDQTGRAVTGGLEDMVGNDGESGWADKRTRCYHMATPDGGNLDTHHLSKLGVHNLLRTITVNGRPATFGGPHNDTVIIATGAEKHFEIIGSLG